MADSNITKRALVNAVIELTAEMPFEKINVGDICQRCQMNRKSFYYHFKDKYDLVNWVFDTDFLELSQGISMERWELLVVMCDYFYENRNFYRRVMKVQGQNSFREHFREFLYPLFRTRLRQIFGDQEIPAMCVDFLTDTLICAIEHWLKDKDCMEPQRFTQILQTLIYGCAENLYLEMKK